MTPQDGDREATQDDRECAIQVMRAVRDLDAATRNLDIVEGLRLAHAAGDLIAAHVAAATAKERQARELAEGELALTRTLLDSERVAKIERGDMYMDALEAGEKNAKRLHWLHDCSTGTTDPEGCEWGIYRVKWVNGKAVEVWATNSDFSDLDEEMERERQAFAPAPAGGKP